jgi:hypothetical protein
MIDRIHVQGNEVAFDDDFEWVNAWAAAEKPQRKSPDQQPIAPDAPRVEAHSSATREEEMPPVAVARNAEAAAPQDEMVSASRASAAALLLDSGSVVPTAVTPPPVAEPVPPPAIMSSVEEAAIVIPVDELIFAFDATSASAKTSAEANEIIDLDLADIVQNTEPPAEANAPISFFEAARRMGRWTSLFRMMTRSGGSSAAAARDLFIAEAPPAAPSLDEPVDGAEQETAANAEGDDAAVAAAKAKAAAQKRLSLHATSPRSSLLAIACR